MSLKEIRDQIMLHAKDLMARGAMAETSDQLRDLSDRVLFLTSSVRSIEYAIERESQEESK